MLKEPFGTYTFQVKSFHSDQNGRLTLHALFQFLQESAWDNALKNDFGFEALDNKNSFWVLSRILVQIDEYPSWKDEIQIKTWPKGADGFFALRDFKIFNKQKKIGSATSSWLILDKQKHRPCRLDQFNFKHDNFYTEHAIEGVLTKIKYPTEEQLKDHRKVYASDLDVNKHVNNATYVRWITDAYFSENNKNIHSFEINFNSELMLNDAFTTWQCPYNQTTKKQFELAQRTTPNKSSSVKSWLN